jgi:hypothetical protein
MFPLLLGLESEEGYQQVSSRVENHPEEQWNKIKHFSSSLSTQVYDSESSALLENLYDSESSALLENLYDSESSALLENLKRIG